MGRKQTSETKTRIRDSLLRYYEKHPEAREKRRKDRTGVRRSKEVKTKTQNSLLKYWEKHPEAKVNLSVLRKKFHAENPDVQRRENNPNWQGGISNLPYSFDFSPEVKNAIRVRDEHKCRICKIHEKHFSRALSIHHIDYDKMNCNDDNLISLCNNCHMVTTSNREYWKQKLGKLIGPVV